MVNCKFVLSTGSAVLGRQIPDHSNKLCHVSGLLLDELLQLFDLLRQGIDLAVGQGTVLRSALCGDTRIPKRRSEDVGGVVVGAE